MISYSAGSAFAATLGVGDAAWNEPHRELRGTYQGILEYSPVPDDFECNIMPQVKHGIVDKNATIDVDNGRDYLFVRVGNASAAKVWQLQIGLSANDLSYDVQLKNNGNQLGGGIYSPDSNSGYSNFAVILKPDASASIDKTGHDHHLNLPEYDKFLDSVGDSSYLTFGLPTMKNQYVLQAVVFDSGANDWIRSDTCGIEVMIPITVDENGVAQVGTMGSSTVKVSDITKELPPLKQHNLGSSIHCKVGLSLVTQNDDGYGSLDSACVTPETKQKLIERGWTQETIQVWESVSESDNYENVCGYPVTDQMRLDIISDASWSSDSYPYLKGHPGNFTHAEKSKYFDDVPQLRYWFDLANGKHVYFEMGACDTDSSNMILGELGTN